MCGTKDDGHSEDTGAIEYSICKLLSYKYFTHVFNCYNNLRLPCLSGDVTVTSSTASNTGFATSSRWLRWLLRLLLLLLLLLLLVFALAAALHFRFCSQVVVGW
uniref:Uncharacterized protein n=1 Tax=Anopheles maculatus TaxID=74869 RepID=A0A182SG49_9DIPT